MRALQGRVLAEKTVGPLLFDNLPGAFGIPQEAYSAYETEGWKMSMTSTVAGDDPEARRIAGELVKLYRAGAIKGVGDPEAQFYAHLIHTVGGDEPHPDGTPGTQPRTRGEHKAFLLAAFKPGDVFDFNNSDNAAEFERLYRKPGQSRNE